MTYWPPVFNELLTLRIPGLVLLLVLFTSTALQSQATIKSSDSPSLESATAIFVLSSSHQKIQILKDEMAAGSARSRQRMTKILNNEQAEVDSFNRALQEAVIQSYSFTDYVFLTDTQVSEWLTRAGANKEFFLIRKSKTESGAEALVMYERTGKRLARPIPYYAKIFRFSSMFDAFFGQAIYTWKDLDKVIARWSERLEKFYE